MAVKVSMMDFLVKLAEKGVAPDLLFEALGELGLDDKYIEMVAKRVSQSYSKRREPKQKNGAETNDLRGELMSMSFDVIRIKSDIDALKIRVSGYEKRLSRIEAKFEALLNTLFEYAPTIFRELKGDEQKV